MAGEYTLKSITGNKLWRSEMDGTGSGSCPVAGFGISGVDPSGPAATVLFNTSELWSA
jgi:hypothetical protein